MPLQPLTRSKYTHQTGNKLGLVHHWDQECDDLKVQEVQLLSCHGQITFS